jgi:hypothetical protein
MALPALIAVPALKLVWELGKQAAQSPAGKQVLRQAGNLVKRVVGNKQFQDAAIGRAGGAITNGFQRAGLGPNGAQVASKVVTDVILKGPDGKLRPEVTRRAKRVVEETAKHVRR